MRINTLVREVLATLHDEFDERPDGLRPGAAKPKILLLEEVIGGKISEDHRSLLRMHDGESYSASCFLLGGRTWLRPTTEIGAEHRELCDLAQRSGRLDVVEPERVTAIGPVKPCYWNRRWVPFWTFDSPWAIDMDPPIGGREGQVLAVAWDDMEVRVEFDSLESMLTRYLSTLKRGKRRFGDALAA